MSRYRVPQEVEESKRAGQGPSAPASGARQAPAIATRPGRDPGGGSGRRRRLERGPPLGGGAPRLPRRCGSHSAGTCGSIGGSRAPSKGGPRRSTSPLAVGRWTVARSAVAVAQRLSGQRSAVEGGQHPFHIPPRDVGFDDEGVRGWGRLDASHQLQRQRSRMPLDSSKPAGAGEKCGWTRAMHAGYCMSDQLFWSMGFAVQPAKARCWGGCMDEPAAHPNHASVQEVSG